MTIASEFNKIAVAHGGTASTSGTIAGAIDALNDALAGSDQPHAQTIEGAIALLGEHIGSEGGGTAAPKLVRFCATSVTDLSGDLAQNWVAYYTIQLSDVYILDDAANATKILENSARKIDSMAIPQYLSWVVPGLVLCLNSDTVTAASSYSLYKVTSKGPGAGWHNATLLDVSVAKESDTYYDQFDDEQEITVAYFTVPDIADDEMLILSCGGGK